MNNSWRYYPLLPLSLLYSWVTATRNWLYDKEILFSKEFNLPVISVGNLAVGGTGKTPHVEFIINHLKQAKNVAVLSRGYKRKTKGFLLADENSTAETIGDEPFQIFRKNRDISVAVDTDRVHGAGKLLALCPQTGVIVLDDAFQHRRIKTGLSILLTDYSRLFIDDSHLPGGNLRESKRSCKRADIIVVTKCPDNTPPINLRIVEKELKLQPYQSLFFSTYVYDEIQPVFPGYVEENILKLTGLRENETGVMAMTGIVKPQPMIDYLKKYVTQIDALFFPDHYDFQARDFKLLEDKYKHLVAENKIIITTEKDAARIVSNAAFPERLKSRTYFLPVRVRFLNNEEQCFINKIENYVTENSRNS